MQIYVIYSCTMKTVLSFICITIIDVPTKTQKKLIQYILDGKILLFFLKKNFVGHICQATDTLIARVASALFELCRGIRITHSLRFTSGVTPLPVYNASIAASRLPHMRVSAEVGCRDLNRDLKDTVVSFEFSIAIKRKLKFLTKLFQLFSNLH